MGLSLKCDLDGEENKKKVYINKVVIGVKMQCKY
jgi:hypothetical protein